ncbi:MAG: hypothetical protein L3J91_03025 [Thermoplasmata archaeon]|nr:hypothetical protein [Thermoplasmata archaeon]
MNNDKTLGALHALRDRGVDKAEELLELATPEQVAAVCRRWDSRSGVGPGLLAHWIRAGDFYEPEPEAKRSQDEIYRAKFDETLARLPVDGAVEAHRDLELRLWRTEIDCDGMMIVAESTYPHLALVCDECGFEAAIPVRFVHLIPDPLPAVHLEDLF